MISRAIKWIFRYHLQKTDQGVTAIAVSHLLNCLFASCHVPTPEFKKNFSKLFFEKSIYFMF